MIPPIYQDLFTVALIFGALFIYVEPMRQAYKSRHPQRRAIMVLNVFAGWTFLGWVCALVWANTHKDQDKRNPHWP